MVDDTEAQDRRNGTRGSSWLAIISKIVVPVSAITALMVYFGWARTSATYSTFGIHHSILGFSVQDYLFSSVADTFEPAALLLLLILVAVPTHLGLIRIMTEPRWRKRTAFFLVVASMALTVAGLLGFLGLVTYQVEWPFVPLSLGMGVGLFGYATLLWRVTSGTEFRPLGNSEVIDVIIRVTFAAFIALTLCWFVAIYAQINGLEEGQRIARQPESLPGVVVFSPRPLFLQGTAVRETVLIGDQQNRYYRYDGLRLLVRASGRYIMLPANWKPGMRVVVLADDPAVRLEFF